MSALHLALFLYQHNYHEQGFDALSYVLELVYKENYDFLVVSDVCCILHLLAYASFLLQDFAEAVSYAISSLSLAPNNASVMLETARLYELVGEDICAEQLYLSCLVREPNDYRILLSYAEFNSRKGNYDIAERYMARGLNLCEDTAEKTGYLVTYGEFLMEKRKRIMQADRCFINVIKFLNASPVLPPTWQRCYFTLGRWAQLERGEPRRAKGYLERSLSALEEGSRDHGIGLAVETHRIPAACHLAAILMTSERPDHRTKAGHLLREVLFEVVGGKEGQMNPSSPWIVLMLASYAQNVTKDLELAEQAYECAADLCQDSPLPGVAYAQFLELSLGRPKFEVHQNCYLKLLQQYPSSVALLVTVAGLYADWADTLPSSSYKAGSLLEEALKCATQAVELCEGSISGAVRCLGVVKARLQAHADAQKLLQAAYALTPKDPCVLRTLGMHIYCQRGANSTDASREAARLLDRSLEVEPNHVPTLNALAFIHLQSLDDDRTAESLLLRAASLDTVTVDTLRTLAHLYHMKGDLSRASGYFKQACRRFTKDPLTMVRYAQYLTSSTKTRSHAKKYFEAAMKVENLSPECYMMYAIYLDQYEKNSDLSYKYLMKAATSKKQPTLAPAFYLVGRHIEANSSHSLDEAEKWYTWALDSTPMNAGSAAAYKQLLAQVQEDTALSNERYKKAKSGPIVAGSVAPSNISRIRKSMKLHERVHKYAQLRSQVLSGQLNRSDHLQWSLLLTPGWEEDYLHILEGRDSWMSLHLMT